MRESKRNKGAGPPREQIIDRKAVIDRFVDGKVEQKEFDGLFKQLMHIFFEERRDLSGVAWGEFSLPEVEKFLRASLEKHLFTAAADKIPQPDEQTGLLSDTSQVWVWDDLSFFAKQLLQLNPASVLHHIIVTESPLMRVHMSKEDAQRRYKWLQRRTVYYKTKPHYDTSVIVRLTQRWDIWDKDDIATLEQLRSLHPSLKVLSLWALKRARKPDGERSKAAEDVSNNAQLRTVIYGFSAKAEVA